jgi:hypothetical protein
MACSSQEITQAMYDRISTGMNYRVIVQILGKSGTELSRNEMAGYVTVMYIWQHRDGSNLNVMLQNDRVIQKAQFGLR